jgi:peptidoglycan/LPS O-acetylase OafA/YrhL
MVECRLPAAGRAATALVRHSRDSYLSPLMSRVQKVQHWGWIGYRPDIDGLRAIAVLSVIAYHFNVGPVPGGFIGVDIFFVISGYLITGIIVEKLDIDAFSFIDFYQRRIRRIFPALVTVLLFMLASGLTVLLRSDELFRVSTAPFGPLYHSIVLGAAFVTNFGLLHETAYFSPNADSQPLLHLWSLAIEEQFYIVWPLLLCGARAMRVQYLAFALAIAAVSFGINVLTVHTDPTAAFYSPLSRAWELMLGAATASVSSERMQRFPVSATVRSAIGLVLIAVALFTVNRHTVFPGWVALAPTIGTLLVISAGPKSLPNRYLSARVLVWIGLISYPLYLWHWPALLLFQKYAVAFEGFFLGHSAFKAVVLLCCVLASWLTFRFVEVPFRFGVWKDARHTVALALSMGAIALIGVLAPNIILSMTPMTPYQRDTVSIFDRVVTTGQKGNLFGDRACFRWEITETAAMFLHNNCLVPEYPAGKTAFVVGDSHAASLSLGLRPLFEHHGMNLF